MGRMETGSENGLLKFFQGHLTSDRSYILKILACEQPPMFVYQNCCCFFFLCVFYPEMIKLRTFQRFGFTGFSLRATDAYLDCWWLGLSWQHRPVHVTLIAIWSTLISCPETQAWLAKIDRLGHVSQVFDAVYHLYFVLPGSNQN